MDVKYRIKKNRYHVFCGREKTSIRFPRGIDLARNPFNEDVLKNNVVSLTWPLAFKDGVSYDFGRVFFSDFVLKTCYTDIPGLAEKSKIKTEELFKKFEEAKQNIHFKDRIERSVVFEEGSSNPEKAVILMSFGKDSLLSFGLARELGLEMSLFHNFNSAEDDDYECRKKVMILRRFMKSFGNKVYLLRDTTARLTEKKLPDKIDEFVDSNILFHFSLLTLPIAYEDKAGSVLIGNEQNFNDQFINKDGVMAYVSSDQSGEFMSELSSMLLEYTNKNVRLMSLVEPIYNLFEVKMIHSRYPELLKYLMSCADDKLKEGMWCCQCPMCAKAFLYTKAFGFDPRKIHLYKNFFEKQHGKLYPLFNNSPERNYEKPQRVRDEQLLSFYLAYKKGAKGYLVNRFKKEFLDEAKERYEELHKTFFGIHKSFTMPEKIKQDVNSIYEEEIGKL